MGSSDRLSSNNKVEDIALSSRNAQQSEASIIVHFDRLKFATVSLN